MAQLLLVHLTTLAPALRLKELHARVEEIEARFADSVFVHLVTFERNGRALHVALTEDLRRSALRGRVWNSRAFLTALQNASYGFDEGRPRSSGGSDGLFLVDRDFRPPNTMMRKLFDHYLDSPRSNARAVARELGVPLESLLPVRLVSHRMRLLGVLSKREDGDDLVVVDYDDGK